MEIKTKKLFKELVKKLTMELLDEESLEEITTTAAVPGYMTPYAFSDGGKKDKKRKVTKTCKIPTTKKGSKTTKKKKGSKK